MIRKVVYGILIFLGVGLFLFYVLQERFIFLNGKKLSKDYVYQFPQAFEEVNITAKDQQTINGLHFQLENPKGIVLFFHGNKGNLERWGKIVPYLLAYDYEVLVVDYRSYGKSTGKFHQEKMYQDALDVYDYVKNQFSESQIVVYGRSLGAAFSAYVGANRNPKHIVLEAPFYNLKKAVHNYFPLAPTFLLKYSFPTNEILPNVNAPVTFFHGDEDGVTSFEESKELFQLTTSKQKEFVTISGGTHHNLKDFDVYQKKMRGLLE